MVDLRTLTAPMAFRAKGVSTKHCQCVCVGGGVKLDNLSQAGSHLLSPLPPSDCVEHIHLNSIPDIWTGAFFFDLIY